MSDRAAPFSASRRACLLAAGALAIEPTRAATAWPTGWVQPRLPAPAVVLVDSDARSQPLPQRLQGQLTVAQLIYTGCGTTCPTQGRLFSHMAERHRHRPVRWLSISIDALGDDPRRLRDWQSQLGAQPRWQAAVPAPQDVDRVVTFLRGGAAGSDSHTTQVFAFDPQGRLAYRSGDATPVALLDQLVERLLAG